MGLIIILTPFLYATCIISSRYSRNEEELEMEELWKKKNL